MYSITFKHLLGCQWLQVHAYRRQETDKVNTLAVDSVIKVVVAFNSSAGEPTVQVKAQAALCLLSDEEDLQWKRRIDFALPRTLRGACLYT